MYRRAVISILTGVVIQACGWIGFDFLDGGMEADGDSSLPDCPTSMCGDGICCAAGGEDACTCEADCGSSGVLITTGSTTVAAGAVFTLHLSTCVPVTSWTINWGDGTIETYAGTPPSVEHTYARAGFTYNILASVVSDGAVLLQNDLLLPSGGDDTLVWYGPSGATIRTQGPDAGLDYPVHAIVGPDGNAYVGGLNSSNVVRYDATTGAYIDEFVPAGLGGLTRAIGLAFGPDGNLYVSSAGTGEVLRYDGSTGAFLGAYVAAGLGGLDEPEGLTFGPDGNLYVSDYRSHAVYRYDGRTGAFVDVFVPASSGGLRNAEDLRFGPDGNLYVVSEGTGEILRYDGTSGAFIDVFASTGLDDPQGLRWGPDGRLYVSNWTGNDVRRYDGRTGVYVDTFVSTGLRNAEYLDFVPGHQVRVLP